MNSRTIATEWLDFVGMNVKGTPRMNVASVTNDVEEFAKHADCGVMCEFRWDYYWGIAKRVLANDKHAPKDRWGSFPGFKQGKRMPVASGQPNFWKRSIFEKVKSKRALCHLGHAGISEARLFRATRITHKITALQHWIVSGHFVVGGDQNGDGPKRKKILRNNIRRFVRFLKKLIKTGKPIIGQLDANIRRGGWAFPLWMEEMKKIGAQFVGELGIEYLFVIDDHSKTKVQVKHYDSLKPRAKGGTLFTDHESRNMTYRLWERVKTA